MALKATYEIRCSCGATFPGEICEYVFAEHEPELKDSILSGEFNRIPCPSCNQRLHAENRFLYRDEKNGLWVWVCGRDEESRKDVPAGERIEQNAFMEFHFLDDRESYRKFQVFGREGLLELLLREDPILKRREGRKLKANPALRWIQADDEDPGYLFLRGEKIRVSIPLRIPEARRNRFPGLEARKRWLLFYSQGLNIHNPYSSFLNHRARSRWNRIREREAAGNSNNEFDDFAESWARRRIDGKGFKGSHPERSRFFDGLKKTDITRRIRPLHARGISRESA